MCTKQELKQITDRITSDSKIMFGNALTSIILYGSYARGDNHEFSDIDIMIIANIKPSEISSYRGKLANVSGQLSLETEDCVTISMSLKDAETFNKYKNILPFYRNVLRDGVTLYAS
jgi:predicted nucleotidyltransferase